MAEEKDKTSAMMKHYRQTKSLYPNAILFYRLGDFYEMFDDDAILVSRLLDITLTAKLCGAGNKAPMCGVPFHSVDSYIAKLLKHGKNVAICEQVGKVIPGKQVEREVVRVITPGTVTSELILEETKNNFIVSVCREKKAVGIAYADISTGEFFTAEYTEEMYARLNDIVTKLEPKQIICNFQTKEMIDNLPINKISAVPAPELYLEKSFMFENAVETLKKQFGVGALTIFELSGTPAAVMACGALLDYLFETQKIVLKQIIKIQKLDLSKYMILDSVARRNLEISEPIRDKRKKTSLLAVLDQTKTSMGARLFRQWLDQPLKDSRQINKRLDGVEEIYKSLILRGNLQEILSSMRDIERLASKIGMNSIMPKECNALAQSLAVLPKLKRALQTAKSQMLQEIFAGIEDLAPLERLISSVIADEPSAHLKDGGYIREGFNADLEKQRNLSKNAGVQISRLESEERERTGIANLRVGYNKVYGYFFEINKELASKVPLDYHRKATVGIYDRYFSESLKKFEDELLRASETAIKLETEIYLALRTKMQGYIEKLQNTSKAVATLDSLISLAETASKNNYVRPEINDRIKEIKIEDGRHPVVESVLTSNQFIPNSTTLNSTDDKILVITGPNMAGKSTYMRQVAIITLMAHIGSFVPAKSAKIAITDRIFTRVGASDDLASGQSTFMVEMTEMANILHNATDKSLIILDEIGRGTSTFDGLSIAWAIIEFFSKCASKVLFATHYHELTELEGIIPGIKNYQISVKEYNNSIVFLRKIIRGGANRSFGIEVASLAGIPQEIITRAKQISHNIAEEDFRVRIASTNLPENFGAEQEVARHNNQVVSMLKDININKISPLEAFEILQDVIKKLK